MKKKLGFTLVELIVVITIITLLVALLAVLIIGVIDRAKYSKTAGIVMALDKGCQNYKVDFGVFPPANKGDSRALHFYLGRERYIEAQQVEIGPPIKVKKPPIIEFQMDWLRSGTGPANPDQPVPIIDPWENDLRYKNPGFYLKNGVDIWSPGKNGQDDLVDVGVESDDVSNWNKDY
jgi:prepilin-type N-terminal cleavage/methylation domain-containing protein